MLPVAFRVDEVLRYCPATLGVLSVFAIAMFCALVCSAMRPGDFVPTSYLPVLVLNCDYWIHKLCLAFLL